MTWSKVPQGFDPRVFSMFAGLCDLMGANPCQNGAACQAQSNGTLTCTCTSGFQGAVCDVAIGQCNPRYCKKMVSVVLNVQFQIGIRSTSVWHLFGARLASICTFIFHRDSRWSRSEQRKSCEILLFQSHLRFALRRTSNKLPRERSIKSKFGLFCVKMFALWKFNCRTHLLK